MQLSCELLQILEEAHLVSPPGQLLCDGCLRLLHDCCSELPDLASQQASEQELVRASFEGKLIALQNLEAPLRWKGAGSMKSLQLDWLSEGLSFASKLGMGAGQISCLSAGWVDEQRMVQQVRNREEDAGHAILAQLGWQSLGEGQTHCWLRELCPETAMNDEHQQPADVLLAMSDLNA